MLTVVSIDTWHCYDPISKSTEKEEQGLPAAGGARLRPARARAHRWTPCEWTTSPQGCSPSARSTPGLAHI